LHTRKKLFVPPLAIEKKKLRGHSVAGRLGDIKGRPNEEDLRDVAARVKGILQI